MILGSTQPLTEMSTRNLPGGKGRTARKADNLTAMSLLSRKRGGLDVSQTYRPPRPVQWQLYLLYFEMSHDHFLPNPYQSIRYQQTCHLMLLLYNPENERAGG
jgi:hypothetical protein